MSRKHVLVVTPTAWDRTQLEAARGRWQEDFDVVLDEPADEDVPDTFDADAYVRGAVERGRGTLDGVFSSSDYPGATLAAAVATELGLPGPTPERVLVSAHKHASRVVQREAAPEAVPPFCLLDLRPGGSRVSTVGFPCFVKPVKGAFSMLARRVLTNEELAEILARPYVSEFAESYLGIFNRLVARYTDLDVDGHAFVAEGLLSGLQVTLEGFVHRGEVELLGVVDSLVDPATRAFLGFTYPSALPESVQERMADVSRRVVLALGLDDTLFNVELMWNPGDDRIGIVEINPRMCGQFADLYEKVDGTNGYEVALELATGGRPRIAHGSGEHRFAASLPLRAFQATRVERAPDAAALERARALFPGTLVWTECAAGDELLAGDAVEDGVSHRYAVVNLGAPSRADLHERLTAVRAELGYELVPL